MTTTPTQNQKTVIRTWAQQMLADGCAILDTETTGLLDNPRAEAIQIALIDHTGTLLYESFIKPVYPIDETSGAFKVNRITQAMVENAPSLPDLWSQVMVALKPFQPLVIYNSDFDLRILERGINAANFDKIIPVADFDWLINRSVFCLMRRYAIFRGERNSRGEFKWWSLDVACHQMSVEGEDTIHRAPGGALAAWRLLKAIAESEGE